MEMVEMLVGSKIEGKTAEELYNEGDALYNLGKYEDAIRCYDMALEITPKHVGALCSKGTSLANLKRFDEALTCAENVIKRTPNKVQAWVLKSWALCELKRYKEALDSAEKAIGLDSANTWAWHTKAWVLAGLKKFEESLMCSEKAIQLDSKNAWAWYNKSWCLYELGRYHEALMSSEKAIELNSRNEWAWYNNGCIFLKLEMLEKAIECFNKALELNPHYELAKSNKKIAERKLKDEKLKEISMPEITDFYTIELHLSELQKSILGVEAKVWADEKILPSLLRKGVFIIVGAWEGCEMFDRLVAHKIANELEKSGIDSVVMTDRYWWEAKNKYGYEKSPVISVGGPISNSLSNGIAEQFGMEKYATAIGIKEIGGQSVGYVWGTDARSTLNAGKIFIESILYELFDNVEFRRTSTIPRLTTPTTQFTTLRTVWDPSTKDFVWSAGKPDAYGELPRIKRWIEGNNPNIYWFLLKIVNHADHPIAEWNVTMHTEQALTITEAHIDEKQVRIVKRDFDTDCNRNVCVVSIPPELGVSIPARGGRRSMYFKMDIRCEDALKMEFGVFGVVKLGKSPQIEVPIREKRFTYACKYGDFKNMFRGSIDTLASQVMENLQSSYSREIVQNFTNSFRLIRDFEKYCNDTYTESETLIDKLEMICSSLKTAEPITKEEILPLVEENMDALRKMGGVETQKERGIRMCEKLIELLHIATFKIRWGAASGAGGR